MVEQKVVEKIQKLLRLGTSSNEHEAKLAMERASDLMRKHQLSMSQVDVEQVKGTGMVRERHHVRGLKMKLHWVVDLAQASAKLFDGEITFVTSTILTNRIPGWKRFCSNACHKLSSLMD